MFPLTADVCFTRASKSKNLASLHLQHYAAAYLYETDFVISRERRIRTDVSYPTLSCGLQEKKYALIQRSAVSTHTFCHAAPLPDLEPLKLILYSHRSRVDAATILTAVLQAGDRSSPLSPSLPHLSASLPWPMPSHKQGNQVVQKYTFLLLTSPPPPPSSQSMYINILP